MAMIIAIAAALLTVTIFFFWIFRDPGYSLNKGLATITLRGKIQLGMLRTAVPIMTGVKKAVGFTKYAMELQPAVELDTRYGTAKLTFYRPLGSKERVLPLYINHHGGGFVVGYPKQDDIICRYLAQHSDCVVVNVDYVLAPEHPYPAQIVQCFEIAEWLIANALKLNIAPGPVAVGGQSAGASIAAALCLTAKALGKNMFCAQILNYGYFDTNEDPSRKFIEPNRSQALGPKILGFFQNLYLPEPTKRTEAFASPLLAKDLSGLPSALIIAAEHDLIKNDSNRYADKLSESGVNVTYIEFENADHGFTHNGPKGPAHTALELMTETLKKAFYCERI